MEPIFKNKAISDAFFSNLIPNIENCDLFNNDYTDSIIQAHLQSGQSLLIKQLLPKIKVEEKPNVHPIHENFVHPIHKNFVHPIHEKLNVHPFIHALIKMFNHPVSTNIKYYIAVSGNRIDIIDTYFPKLKKFGTIGNDITTALLECFPNSDLSMQYLNPVELIDFIDSLKNNYQLVLDFHRDYNFWLSKCQD